MAITSDIVEDKLTQHGYTVVRRTDGHALYEHHGDRVVVPHHSPALSPWTVRAIEWSLEPRLGRGWLTTALGDADPPAAHEERGPRRRLHLSLVVRAEPDLGAWNAFVAEEPRILTFGATLAETQQRAADAAAAWFADTAEVELELRPQLDAVTQGWVDHTAGPTHSPMRTAEARHQLARLGMTDDDIAELLDRSPISREGEPDAG